MVLLCSEQIHCRADVCQGMCSLERLVHSHSPGPPVGRFVEGLALVLQLLHSYGGTGRVPLRASPAGKPLVNSHADECSRSPQIALQHWAASIAYLRQVGLTISLNCSDSDSAI